MEQRTCNIIMCCKGYGKGWDSRDRIMNYMSRECEIDRRYYSEGDLTEVLYQATLDYLSEGSGKEFIRYFFDSHFTERNDAIMSALSLVKVKDNGVYINGFTEELIEQSKKDLMNKDGICNMKKDTSDNLDDFVSKILNKLRDRTFKIEIDGIAQNEWTRCLSFNDDICPIFGDTLKEFKNK